MASPPPDQDMLKNLPIKQLVLIIIWAALLLGMLCFTGVSIILIVTGGPATKPAPIFFQIAIGAALALPILGLMVRHIVIARAQRRNKGIVGAWIVGNIACWALCELAVFYAVIVAIVSGSTIPGLLPAAWGLLMFVLAFPRRRALMPQSTTFDIEG